MTKQSVPADVVSQVSWDDLPSITVDVRNNYTEAEEVANLEAVHSDLVEAFQKGGALYSSNGSER
jgi:hypothetical protein